MGEIVAAYGVSHASMMIRSLDRAPVDRAERVTEAWRQLRGRLADANPDVVLMIARDHGHSFFLDNYPTFAVGVGDTFTSWGDAAMPVLEIPGDRAISQLVVDGLINAGFDVSTCHDAKLDHGFVVPLRLLRPELDIPVIPFFQNGFVPPLPLFDRCYELGQALRTLVEDADIGSVAVVATGGVSHWVGESRMGEVNEEFDRHILDLMASGNIAELLQITPETIEEELGNGGHEMNAWVTMLGIAGGNPIEVLAYEPIPAWATGIAVAEASIGPVPRVDAVADLVPQPEHFAAPYALMEFVHRLCTDPEFAVRFVEADRQELLEREFADVFAADAQQALVDLDVASLGELGVPGPMLFALTSRLRLPELELFPGMAPARD